MTFRTFVSQIQQQHQESPGQGTPPGPATTVDADIAAFLAEGHEPDDIQADTGPADDSVADAEPLADSEEEPNVDADSADADSDGPDLDTEGEAEAAKPSAVDLKAVQAALDADDPVAFVQALGKKAETLLGSKAHIALRIAVKEAEKVATVAKGEQTKAHDLAVKLGEKYGDPIAARKACEGGDVDSFLDLIEKWSGHPWNDVVRWASNGIAGRKERLEQKARQENAQSVEATARQEQKQAEVRAWVDGGVKKLAPELHDPDTVDLVVAEIRAGYTKGITTPAKALPLVRAKLEARYKKLHAVFGKGVQPKGKRPPAPSAAAAHTNGGSKTRRSTLEEDIAWAKQQARSSK